MTTLVTGAAGFIGSHLSKRLEDTKNNLVLTDNFIRGKQEYLDYLGVTTECIPAELTDYEHALYLTKSVDTVFHCACRIGGMQFLHGTPKKELYALQENLAIDNNIFRACIENKVKKIIYTSSVSVYNTNLQNTTRTFFSESDLEIDKLVPEGGYGWAKFIGEKQLEFLSKAKVKVGVARIFKSYGPCDDYSVESGQVVCSLFRKAMDSRAQFTVWGDGSVERSLVYIDDLVDALILLSKEIDYGSLTVNIGGEESISMKRLAKEIKKLTGVNKVIKYYKKKPAGPKNRIPNLSLAKETLNWEPKIPLNTGLRRTHKWMKKCM